MTVCEEIAAERARQDAKWGGPVHDDEHGPNEWLGFIVEHLRAALDGALDRNGRLDQVRTYARAIERVCGDLSGLLVNRTAYRRELVRVAALAIAAIESLDRGGRR